MGGQNYLKPNQGLGMQTSRLRAALSECRCHVYFYLSMRNITGKAEGAEGELKEKDEQET